MTRNQGEPLFRSRHPSPPSLSYRGISKRHYTLYWRVYTHQYKAQLLLKTAREADAITTSRFTSIVIRAATRLAGYRAFCTTELPSYIVRSSPRRPEENFLRLSRLPKEEPAQVSCWSWSRSATQLGKSASFCSWSRSATQLGKSASQRCQSTCCGETRLESASVSSCSTTRSTTNKAKKKNTGEYFILHRKSLTRAGKTSRKRRALNQDWLHGCERWYSKVSTSLSSRLTTWLRTLI